MIKIRKTNPDDEMDLVIKKGALCHSNYFHSLNPPWEACKEPSTRKWQVHSPVPFNKPLLHISRLSDSWGIKKTLYRVQTAKVVIQEADYGEEL